MEPEVAVFALEHELGGVIRLAADAKQIFVFVAINHTIRNRTQAVTLMMVGRR